MIRKRQKFSVSLACVGKLTYTVQPSPEAVMVVESDLSTIGYGPGRRSIALGEDGTALAWDLGEQHHEPVLVRHLAFHLNLVDELQ